MRTSIVGCVVSPLLTLAFYGAIAVIFITLVFYPVIYIQDVSSADAYGAASGKGI